MTRIVLTRHGQTEWNVRPPRFRGRAELALTETGLEQARATARRICDAYDPCAVYTSPLGRCVTTGEIIARPLKLTSRALAGLNDIDYGAWQGLTAGEAKAGWPEEFATWSETPYLARPPAGETLQEMLARVSDTVRELLREHPRDTAVLVGHDSVNRVLLLHALGLPLSSYPCLAQDNAAISEIEFSDGRFRLKAMNETFHLESLQPWLAPRREVDTDHQSADLGAHLAAHP